MTDKTVSRLTASCTVAMLALIMIDQPIDPNQGILLPLREPRLPCLLQADRKGAPIPASMAIRLQMPQLCTDY